MSELTARGGLLVGVSVWHGDKDSLRLGMIWVESRSKSLAECRQLLRQQLPPSPPSFVFLSKHRWIIPENKEADIELGSILDENGNLGIQRQFDHPRLGIEAEDGTALGFVFLQLNSTLQQLRSAIKEQLHPLPAPCTSIYKFLDGHGWPVTTQQEATLWVLDVLCNDRVRLRPGVNLRTSSFHILSSSNSRDSSVISYKTPTVQRTHPLQQLTFGTGKDASRQGSVDTVDSQDGKQVLISYVRAEAAHHALKLKAALLNKGFSVYLDVHEIKTGVDWQDSLNHAVSTCEAFVPLVTPRYGETQWTNREVKLADVLSKFILPVCFLNYWPPRCLAIQFATTQFVPWKTPHVMGEEGEEEDTSFWDDQLVEAVAEQIGQRIADNDPARTTPTLVKKNSLLSVSLADGYTQVSQCREGKPMVLISVHPKQRKKANKLRDWLLEKGYEVCCSLDLVPQYDLDSDILFSQESGKKDDSGETADVMAPDSPLNLKVCLSQLSIISEDVRRPELQTHQKGFQTKADEAGVVLFLLSKSFAASRTCQQQVFYCESRKRVIPVRCEEFCMPGWLSMLIGTGMFQDFPGDGFEHSLLSQVQQYLDPNVKQCMRAKEEQRINQAAMLLKQQLPPSVFVYIAGGRKFYHAKSKQICEAIGLHLSELGCVSLATGGFSGVGRTVGETYNAQRQKQGKDCTLWNVLPVRDDQDRSHLAPQSEDMTFGDLPYGHTLFSGNSVRDRENIVSRVFDICILIEGGPGAAHEAEQFVWNDRIVIPVPCTGGAAAGKFNVPKEAQQIPQGVEKQDWGTLADKEASPDHIGQSLSRIIRVVHDTLKSERCSPCRRKKEQKSPTKEKSKVEEPSSSFTRLRTPSRKRKETPRKDMSEAKKVARDDTLILEPDTATDMLANDL